MKKFFTIFAVTMLLVLSAGATEVSLQGIAGNWNSSSYKTTDIVDNCATFTVSKWDASWTFKVVCDGKWYGKDTTLAKDTWTPLDEGGYADNLSLDSSAAGQTVTITFAVNTHEINVKWGEGGGSNPGGGQNPGGGTPGTPTTPGSYPDVVYLMGNINGNGWTPYDGVPANGNNGVYTWNIVEVGDAGAGLGYFSFVTSLSPIPSTDKDQMGIDWGDVNATNRYGSTEADAPLAANGSAPVQEFIANVNCSAATSWAVPAGKYTYVRLDLTTMTVSLGAAGVGGGETPGGGGGDTPVTPPTPNPGSYPAILYMMGNANGNVWAPNQGVAAYGNNGVYEWTNVEITGELGTEYGYVNFSQALGSSGAVDEWDAVVNASARYGAPEADYTVEIGREYPVAEYQAGLAASGTQSYMIPVGIYNKFTVNLATMTFSINGSATAVASVNSEEYVGNVYNAAGMVVARDAKNLNGLSKGLYIFNGKKVLVK